MEEMYGFRCTPDFYDQAPLVAFPADFQAFDEQIPIFGSPEQMFSATSSSAVSDAASIQRNNSTGSEDNISSAIRAKIASHPLYPKLLQAYIDCQKVGALSEIADLFDELGREKDLTKRPAVWTYLGDDPELDDFMETYCEVLVKYKLDLTRPFNEATVFLKNIETQLHSLCNDTSRTHASDEAAASSEEDCGSGEIDVQECSQMSEDRELKNKLFRKYSGYISLLKHEFSNKKKKAKLPREARQALLDWWNIHYKWPYPTVNVFLKHFGRCIFYQFETPRGYKCCVRSRSTKADKVALAESTGLDQKQINNWFINQRKRHW